jgi:serine/threonine protein kinase/tetratricopeptide (TPR) repeat protein
MKELSPERWRAVREVFEAALELADGERETFLDRTADGDAELRGEVGRLLAAHRRAGGFMASPAARLADPDPPDPAQPPAPTLHGRLGPYRLLGELGRGGMGHVYLAERADGAYSMRVAVKVLAAGLDSEEARLRFHGERQILADLDHPGIARLLDGGTISDGRPYLVMEVVEGEPIDEYCDRRRLDVGARVELFARVCETVHYAHRSLVVHRDLKPSHIVIAADGEPKLLDFGIAKLLAPRAGQGFATTAPLARPLTPRYASPEQLRGGRVTPASDVYSLGVVLYELLCGRPPYQLDSDLKAVVETVCETDPPSPSAARWPVSTSGSDTGSHRQAAAEARAATPRSLRRRLAGDLDAITLRALAKEPARRYATAGELATELGRHRCGEPVLTRAASLGYRLQRRLRRNKPMAAVMAIGLVGVLAAGGTIQRQRAAGQRQVKLAQEFGQRGQELAALMRQAAMLPSHDVRSDRARVRQRMDSIRRQAHDLGPAATVPASYALGLGHLALDELDAARSELEEAWSGGLQTPSVAYALGETYARLYRRDRLLFVPSRRDGDDGGGGAAYRAEALAMLERSRAAETANPHYIAAQIAFAEGDYTTALAASRRSIAAQPWRYESHYLAAETLRELAIASANDGDYELAFERFDEGRRTTDVAIEVARSDPRNWVLACSLELWRSIVGVDGGDSSREAMVQALSLCDQALATDPDSVDARIVKAELWRWIGDHDAQRGVDPAPAFRRGLEILAKVRDPRSDNGHLSHAAGNLHQALATWTMERGGDPTDHLRAAEEALVRAAEHLPNSAGPPSALGLVYLRKWLWEFGRGRAGDAFERGVASFQEALRLKPGDGTVRGQLGMLFGRRAMLELDSGADPEPFLSSAIRHLDQAVGTNPRDPYNLVLLGACHTIRARRTFELGDDPEDDLLTAEARLRSALASNPDFIPAIHNLGVAERIRAAVAAERGEDPSSAVAAGRDVFAQLAVDYSTEHELGELALAEARWRATVGDDAAAAAFAAARKHFDRSAELNPQEPRIYEARARAALAEARWLSGRGRSPAATAAIERGLGDTGRALELMPNLARAGAVAGALLGLQAAMEPDAARRAALAGEAIARLEDSLAANPLLEHLYRPELEAARELDASWFSGAKGDRATKNR